VVNKKIYINGTGIISPQKTFDNNQFLDEINSMETIRLKCIDPSYKEFVSGDMVRRMSRIIKMGVAASKICLQDAHCTMPDAIITATGLGCIEDTEKFLTSMILNKEEEEPWALRGLVGKGLAGAALLYFLVRLIQVLWGVPLAIGEVKAPLPSGFGTTQAMADVLFGSYLFPFEAVSLVLLIAVVGALVLAHPDHANAGEEELS